MAEEPMRPRCRDLAVHTVKLAWYANFTSWGLVVRRTHSCLARTFYMRGMRRGARAVCAAVHARPHMSAHAPRWRWHCHRRMCVTVCCCVGPGQGSGFCSQRHEHVSPSWPPGRVCGTWRGHLRRRVWVDLCHLGRVCIAQSSSFRSFESLALFVGSWTPNRPQRDMCL